MFDFVLPSVDRISFEGVDGLCIILAWLITLVEVATNYRFLLLACIPHNASIGGSPFLGGYRLSHTLPIIYFYIINRKGLEKAPWVYRFWSLTSADGEMLIGYMISVTRVAM